VPSHTDVRSAAVGIGVLFAGLTVGAALLQPPPTTESSGPPGREEIARALDLVKADPNLATERTITTLQWRNSSEKKTSKSPAWMAWIAGLFGWIGQSARVLVWCAVAVLAGMLVVFLVRLARGQRTAAREAPFVAPTHVRDLDIRPETLPADIGAAARALWDRGAHRAALSLLYRGLLSRLVHVHRIPIRDSSTEGDCLALAARHLAPAKHEYASRLVHVWQRAVYAQEEIQASAVHPLCDGFTGALGAQLPSSAAAPEVTA
jgi:hypothetical protein